MTEKEYCEAYTSMPSEALQRLDRKTHLQTLAPQMISGAYQGRLLSMISHMIAPMVVLEIGTFTGYSAICLAEGLAHSGKVHTIDINPEYNNLVKKSVKDAGMEDRIQCYHGDALEIIPGLDLIFDLVFIDASKLHYQQYFDLIIDKVRKGGFILSDNMLWDLKVLTDDDDPNTLALKDFAHSLHHNESIENVLLPVRDGLMICRKK